MNWDTIKGNWHELKGSVREKWGSLTNDELDRIAGDREQLIGRLQQHYGHTREQAENEIDLWVEGLGEPALTQPAARSDDGQRQEDHRDGEQRHTDHH